MNITANAPTRITETTSTCLYLIAVSRNYSCITYNIGNLAVSDHFPVETEIELGYESITFGPIYRRNFNKINYGLLNNEMSKIYLSDILEDDPNALLTLWTSETE